MNLRSNKGYTGTDILIATLVLMIFLPTIVSLIYNIQKNQNQTDRKTYALNLATNVIEIAKSSNINTMNTTNEVTEETLATNNFYYKLKDSYPTANLTQSESTLTFSVEDSDGNQYRVSTTILDYQDYPNKDSNIINQNIIKKITVKVEYRVGNNTKNVEISTLKTIE